MASNISWEEREGGYSTNNIMAGSTIYYNKNGQNQQQNQKQLSPTSNNKNNNGRSKHNHRLVILLVISAILTIVINCFLTVITTTTSSSSSFSKTESTNSKMTMEHYQAIMPILSMEQQQQALKQQQQQQKQQRRVSTIASKNNSNLNYYYNINKTSNQITLHRNINNRNKNQTIVFRHYQRDNNNYSLAVTSNNNNDNQQQQQQQQQPNLLNGPPHPIIRHNMDNNKHNLHSFTGQRQTNHNEISNQESLRGNNYGSQNAVAIKYQNENQQQYQQHQNEDDDEEDDDDNDNNNRNQESTTIQKSPIHLIIRPNNNKRKKKFKKREQIFLLKPPPGKIIPPSNSTIPNNNMNDDNNNHTQQQQTQQKQQQQLPRILVIYFPQYHPDPINDKHWGTNFTDWVSLQGSPLKNRYGYTIPRPTELGYYDLRDTDIRRRQGQLAKQYGIDGFIYHTYWFYDPITTTSTTHSVGAGVTGVHGGPTLAAPLMKMLQDGQPDVPFLLNWCAVRWSNVWMGKAVFNNTDTTTNNNNNNNDTNSNRQQQQSRTLQDQYFNATNEMIKEHYQWLSQFFHHKNYIKVNNKPALLLYYYDKQVLRVVERLSRFARILDGFDGIHWIVGRSAAPDHLYAMPKDIAVLNRIINEKGKNKKNITLTIDEEEKRLYKLMAKKSQTLDLLPMDQFDQSMTYPYPLEYVTKNYEIPEWCLKGSKLRYMTNNIRHPEITGIITSFDNTPRREYDAAHVYRPAEPNEVLNRFYDNLYAAVYFQTCCLEESQSQPQEKQQQQQQDVDKNQNDHNNHNTDDRFVVINAWNEWAEGMSIEPSDVYGRKFLEMIQKVKITMTTRNICNNNNISSSKSINNINNNNTATVK